jgi:hypothetical protein
MNLSDISFENHKKGDDSFLGSLDDEKNMLSDNTADPSKRMSGHQK